MIKRILYLLGIVISIMILMIIVSIADFCYFADNRNISIGKNDAINDVGKGEMKYYFWGLPNESGRRLIGLLKNKGLKVHVSCGCDHSMLMYSEGYNEVVEKYLIEKFDINVNEILINFAQQGDAPETGSSE